MWRTISPQHAASHAPEKNHRTAVKLSVAEQAWRLAFDAAPHGIAIVELDHRISHVNRSLCALLGYTAEEFAALTFVELTHPDDLARDAVNFPRLRDGSLERYSVEKRYRHHAGHWVWVHRSMGAVRDPESGAPLRYVATIEDISERIAIAESATRALVRQRAIIAAQAAIAEVQLDKCALRDEMCLRAMALTRGTGAVVELIEDGELVCRATAGQLALHHLGTHCGSDGTLSQRCVDRGLGLLSDDTETDPRVRRAVARTLSIRSMLVVPLRVGERIVGVLKVVAPWAQHFTMDDLRALELLAAPFGAALRNADEHEASTVQALTDPLTGLTNRQGGLQALRHALANRTPGERVAVLFVDLDGFKRVNDVRGHRVGDAVLVGVADRIRQVIRRDDTVARFGGDEFVVIIENLTTKEEADLLAARLVEWVCAPYPIPGEAPAAIGASVGIAIGNGCATLTELLDAADRAMYSAKQHGGGHLRVLVA